LGGDWEDQVITGSSEESMSVRPSSHQRNDYDPVSFGDIPPEVVRNSFLYLSSWDLAAVRLVCRGWNPTGQDVLMCRLSVKHSEMVYSGLRLRGLVGFKDFPIKTLELDMKGIGYLCALSIACYASPTLTSIKLDFDESVDEYYFALKYILNNCRGIRHLQLTGFDVGGDLADRDDDILRVIKDGLSRLTRLNLIQCRGNLVSLVEQNDIPNNRSLNYETSGDSAQESEEIIMAVALKYPTLTSIRLEAEFDSSASLLKLIECCPDLEKLVYVNKGGNLVLSRSDILSLRRLKSLDIDCLIEDDAVSALASCRSLKSLRVVYWDLSEVLPVIGGNLVRLEIEVASEEVLVVIPTYCLNLHYLEIGGVEASEESIDAVKIGMVKLAKLKVNGASVCLGTDWEGIDV
jgi:hypothetical protein